MWNFSRDAERTAIITDHGQSLSYAELEVHSKAWAEGIEARTLGFILCKNVAGSLVGYIACIQHKIVPLMLASSIDKELLLRFNKLYDPAFLWVPQALSEELAALSQAAIAYSDLGYVRLERHQALHHALYPKLALLLTTSGSTGSPRVVRQSYQNLEANTSSIVKYLNLSQNERAITVLPMNYTYGLSVINTHLAVGATVLMTDGTIMQRDFWDFMLQEQATSMSGVPYTYAMLDRLRFDRRQLPALKTITQAGGRLSDQLQEKFAHYAHEHAKQFVVMYGQAEATARICYLPAERCLEKIGSVGIAIPGVTLSILDETGVETTKPKIQGELICRGDNVTLGYAEKIQDLALGDELHGVLHTGDLAYFDDDGYIHIFGRKKRFLKVFGNRVSLDAIEELILKAFPKLDCACTGEDDALEVFINDESWLKSVQKLLAEKTKLNFTAFKVHFISSIPRNDAGKIQYAKLKKL